VAFGKLSGHLSINTDLGYIKSGYHSGNVSVSSFGR
jgi:hypothetical protein